MARKAEGGTKEPARAAEVRSPDAGKRIEELLLSERIQGYDARIGALEERLESEMRELRRSLTERIEEVRDELRTTLRAELAAGLQAERRDRGEGLKAAAEQARTMEERWTGAERRLRETLERRLAGLSAEAEESMGKLRAALIERRELAQALERFAEDLTRLPKVGGEG